MASQNRARLDQRSCPILIRQEVGAVYNHNGRISGAQLIGQASDEPVIPLDYVIALSAGARKLTDFISDRLFVQMTEIDGSI